MKPFDYNEYLKKNPLLKEDDSAKKAIADAEEAVKTGKGYKIEEYTVYFGKKPSGDSGIIVQDATGNKLSGFEQANLEHGIRKKIQAAKDKIGSKNFGTLEEENNISEGPVVNSKEYEIAGPDMKMAIKLLQRANKSKEEIIKFCSDLADELEDHTYTSVIKRD